VFTVANVCCGHTYRLVNVALEQSLFDDRISFRGGRIAAGDEFLASPLYGNFVQDAFNGNTDGHSSSMCRSRGSDGDVGNAGPRAAHQAGSP
jgi:carbohydrate-selective porin OprB